MKWIILSGTMIFWLLAPAAHALTTWYVDDNRPNDSGSGTSWSTAFQTIQAAVDAAEAGDTVLVNDGLYATGSRTAPDQVLCGNRVAIDKPISVQSVNGAAHTTIRGAGPRGASAVRGVWMMDGAILDGFTVANGFTSKLGGAFKDDDGGGIFCTSEAAQIRNCILSGNSARNGGGVCSGTLSDCTLSENTATSGGGVYYSALDGCILSGNTATSGGGAYFGTLDNCALTGNAATSGGGAYYATLHSCTLSGNTASYSGGGTHYGSLDHCTLSGNTASSFGGGAYYGTLNNCALWDNAAVSFGGGAYASTLNNCTLTRNTASTGGGTRNATLKNCILYSNGTDNLSGCDLSICFTNNPLFADPATANFRLSGLSVCIDAGLNALTPASPHDLDGNARIVNGTVDIGAYEYQGADLNFITAIAGSNGSISPDGKVPVPDGSGRSFTFTPDPYYRVADVLTNGVSLGLAGASSFTWPNVRSDGTLQVTFAALMALNDVPQWWLARYGWTSNFDAAALADTDGDGHAACEEYVMGFDPTDRLSALNLRGEVAAGTFRLEFLTAAGRFYTVETRDTLADGVWKEYMYFGGIGGMVRIYDGNMASNGFFRVRVEIEE